MTLQSTSKFLDMQVSSKQEKHTLHTKKKKKSRKIGKTEIGKKLFSMKDW